MYGIVYMIELVDWVYFTSSGIFCFDANSILDLIKTGFDNLFNV